MVCASVQSIISPYRRTNHALSLTFLLTEIVTYNKYLFDLSYVHFANSDETICTILCRFAKV